MIQHAFYKEASPVVKEATKKYFESLEPVKVIGLNRFEAPIQSIRRIMGENFYDFENSKDDLITIKISDGASFSIESIKSDIANNSFTIMNEVALFPVDIYDKFASMYGNTIIGKDFEEVKFKVGITTAKGLICKELTIKDFAPLSTFDDAGNVTGFIGSNEIITLNGELQSAVDASKKLSNAGAGAVSNAAYETLNTTVRELNKKLISKYMSIIETFFNLIKGWGEVDKVTEIWNVTFIFNQVVVDNDPDPENQSGKHSIVETDVWSLHDIAHKHLTTLKEKFD